ncbi:hypothetical protein C0J52_23148 [Blattella germanica]|nr:hypothetical protein C0J52_23148 [Blattella germanica]
MNFPEIKVWCELSYRDLIGPFFFDGSVICEAYLQNLQISILLAIRDLYGDGRFYFQKMVPQGVSGQTTIRKMDRP